MSDFALFEQALTQYENGRISDSDDSDDDDYYICDHTDLVTENGKPTIFYEGGQGYTNSVLKRVIDYWEKEEITSTLKESIKFSTLITSDVNWLHLDVEGLDDKLLYSLTDEQYLNLDLIIFEYNNLSTEERENIDNFIKLKNFTTFKEKGICLAVKNI